MIVPQVFPTYESTRTYWYAVNEMKNKFEFLQNIDLNTKLFNSK